jgi:hypothetical protein
MARIYLSSTFKDLEAHRLAVFNQLTSMQHQVTAMEHYVATDQRPADKCIDDVRKSDLYIGLFAWRYGYVPPKENPKQLSVTELEYEAAEKKPRLIFLVDPAAAWSPTQMDSQTGENDNGARMRALRARLQEDRLIKFFTSPEDLAARVAASVHVAGALAEAQDVKIDLHGIVQSDLVNYPDQLFKASGLPILTEGLIKAGSTRLMTIDLQRNDYWWSTRLYGLATLAHEFTPAEWLMFVEDNGKYVGMARPIHVRRALAAAQPELENDYRALTLPARAQEPAHFYAARVLDALAAAFAQHPGGEQGLRFVVSAQWIRDHVLELVRTQVESRGPIDPLATYLLLNKDTPFVPMTENGQVLKVIDRVGVATEIARQHLEQQINRARG